MLSSLFENSPICALDVENCIKKYARWDMPMSLLCLTQFGGAKVPRKYFRNLDYICAPKFIIPSHPISKQAKALQSARLWAAILGVYCVYKEVLNVYSRRVSHLVYISNVEWLTHYCRVRFHVFRGPFRAEIGKKLLKNSESSWSPYRPELLCLVKVQHVYSTNFNYYCGLFTQNYVLPNLNCGSGWYDWLQQPHPFLLCCTYGLVSNLSDSLHPPVNWKTRSPHWIVTFSMYIDIGGGGGVRMGGWGVVGVGRMVGVESINIDQLLSSVAD